MRSLKLFVVLSFIGIVAFVVSSPTSAQSRTNTTGTGGIHEIRGRVYLPDGKSLDNPVEVELHSSSHSTLKVFTDRNGSYSFRFLIPGPYTVIINGGDNFDTAREYAFIGDDLNLPIRRVTNPKIVTIPVHLQLKRGVILRNEVINAKWSKVPEAAVDHLKKGVELAERGKTVEAEAELRRAIELSPSFAPAHTELGKLILQRGNAEAAVEVLKTAIRYDEADFEGHLTLGIALLNLNKYEQAEPALVSAAYLEPTAVRPHYYLGIVFVMRNDLNVAQKAFEKAKELRGGARLPNIHKFLGRIYMKKEMLKEAIHEFETYLKLSPNAQDADKVKKDITDTKAKQLKNAFV